LTLGHADVPLLAGRAGCSLEVAGRNARLAFFAGLAAGPERPVIALAHTRSDQAETVLLRLARGAGPRGLAGMAPVSGSRIRPLLEIDRAELRAWLHEQGQRWREDPTNDDLTIVRNRIRHAVIPQLAHVNPAVEGALARAARIQAADGDLLDRLADAEVGRLVKAATETVQLDLAGVRRLPEALGRRVIRRALMETDPGHTPDWEATEAVLHGVGSRLDLGRVRVELFPELAVLSIRARGRRRRAGGASAAPVQALDVPGIARHPAGWWEVEATGPTLPAHPVDHRGFPESTQVVLDARALGRHLTIRAWRAGDRVQPLGLGGRKKLQDVFVDRKVPRDERDRVPVVVDAQGRIAWVAGHAVGEPFRVTPRSEAVVTLTLRR
jgi:tRNA(Ile)-lysidine synthase